jgi:hypothetical protein
VIDQLRFLNTQHCNQMIVRRSVILALGSIPLLARAVFSQSAVKARRVGLLSWGAPFTDTSPVVVGLAAGFPSAAMFSEALCFWSGG